MLLPPHPIKRLASSEPSWQPPELDRSFKRQRTLDVLPRPSNIVVTSSRIPSGWYTGSLDDNGHRVGYGTTQHDDGTMYTGYYVKNEREGWGESRIPVVRQETTTWYRTTERVFRGNFKNDAPCGKGMLITTVMDVPKEEDTLTYVRVTFDVGSYQPDGQCVGEGVRFCYTQTRSSHSRNRTEWVEECRRTRNGECTGVVVGRGYGEWVCDCLGLSSYPVAPEVHRSEATMD